MPQELLSWCGVAENTVQTFAFFARTFSIPKFVLIVLVYNLRVLTERYQP